MNKNKFGLLIVVVLIAIASVFILGEKNSTIWGNESNFAVSDTANIVKIFMVDKNNRSITIERDGHSWVLNGHLKAHTINMRMLLKTLKNLEVKYPVPRKMHNNIVKSMAGNAIKVEIYKNDYHINIGQIHLFPFVDKARVFYVGSATQDNQGTFMLIEGAERPYVVTIPGFRGFVSARFTTDPKDWLSHEIFRIKYNHIADIKVETPENPNRSFEIRKLDEGYEIMSLANRQILPAYDTVALFTFLDSFKNINYESLLDEMPQEKIDSLLSSQPSHIIHITEDNGTKHELKTYKMRSGYDQEEKYGYEPNYDLDRMYAWYKGQMLMVQYYTFDKITRPVDFFKPHQ